MAEDTELSFSFEGGGREMGQRGRAWRSVSVSGALLEQNEKAASWTGIKESGHAKRRVKGLAGHVRKCESTCRKLFSESTV